VIAVTTVRRTGGCPEGLNVVPSGLCKSSSIKQSIAINYRETHVTKLTVSCLQLIFKYFKNKLVYDIVLKLVINNSATTIFVIYKLGTVNVKNPSLLILSRLQISSTVCGRLTAEIVEFDSHRRHGCVSVVNVVLCQVGVSVTSWSLVQRCPSDCGASLCVIYKPRKWGGPDPLVTVAPQTTKQISSRYPSYCGHYDIHSTKFSRTYSNMWRFPDVSEANSVPIYRVCWWVGRTQTIESSLERVCSQTQLSQLKCI